MHMFIADMCEDAPRAAGFSYWDLIDHYRLDAAAERFHDAGLPWLNRNSKSAVDRLVRSRKMRLVAQIRLFLKYVVKEYNFAAKVTSPEAFEAGRNTPLTMWRGGGGTYDPDYDLGRSWCSFTLDRRRAETFSKYNGTYAVRSVVLPTRSQHWTIQLTLPISRILMYFPQGFDEEAIVSTEDAKHATLIEQT